MTDTTALILDIDSENTINKSNTTTNQNVIKDLFEFDSVNTYHYTTVWVLKLLNILRHTIFL